MAKSTQQRIRYMNTRLAGVQQYFPVRGARLLIYRSLHLVTIGNRLDYSDGRASPPR